MPHITLIAHNIRSTHNVGSIFRTADGFGIAKIILSGYTPYPQIPGDTRLPHIRDKLSAQIHKTALGAELTVPFEYRETLDLGTLDLADARIVALEQNDRSINLRDYIAPDRLVLIIGEEVHGIPEEMLDACDDVIEIPMVGTKESFNVSVATGIALYALAT